VVPTCLWQLAPVPAMVAPSAMKPLSPQAHMSKGAYVRIMGVLRPGRQPRQLTDVTSFEVMGVAGRV
jgi:hypothetical protein